MRNRSFLLSLALCLFPLGVSAQEVTREGPWMIVTVEDAMTDERSVKLIHNGDDEDSRTLSFAFQCQSGKPWPVVLFGGYMARPVVTVRFDTGEPLNFNWTAANNRAAAISASHVNQIVPMFDGASRLVVRVRDSLDGETKTESFDISAFNTVFPNLECVSEASQGS
jgi:hypothetical protein